MKESDIEKYLHKQITVLGGTTRKWVSPGRTGVPDRICFSNRKVFFVEVKTDSGRLTVRQQREIESLTEHGAEIYTVYGFKGVDDLILRMEADKWNIINS